jgi:hypothetical protein
MQSEGMDIDLTAVMVKDSKAIVNKTTFEACNTNGELDDLNYNWYIAASSTTAGVRIFARCSKQVTWPTMVNR